MDRHSRENVTAPKEKFIATLESIYPPCRTMRSVSKGASLRKCRMQRINAMQKIHKNMIEPNEKKEEI